MRVGLNLCGKREVIMWKVSESSQGRVGAGQGLGGPGQGLGPHALMLHNSALGGCQTNESVMRY